MAGEPEMRRGLVEKALRDPNLPWGESEDALAVAERLIQELENTALQVLTSNGPADDKLLELSGRIDANEQELNEKIVKFTPGIWQRIKGGGAIPVAVASAAAGSFIPPLFVVSAISIAFVGDDALKWIGMETMRVRLKRRRQELEEAARLVRQAIELRGL